MSVLQTLWVESIDPDDGSAVSAQLTLSQRSPTTAPPLIAVARTGAVSRAEGQLVDRQSEWLVDGHRQQPLQSGYPRSSVE